MFYYILFMCFTTSNGWPVCTTAQFPDLKQCQHSVNIVINKTGIIPKTWCQQVRK